MRHFIQSMSILVLMSVVSGADAQSDAAYLVLTNDEGLHAIWTPSKDLPAGWTATKTRGDLKQCSAYIEEVWTDMRPRSMQKKYKKKMKDGYVVVVNHEEQYMIWPREEYVPEGWDLAGAGGSYTDCAAHIKKVWTDMRPLSLRQ